ncbi:MAG: hypothetical protein LBU90_06740 [Bacteroidales bacterium]|jgi:hypothetical protein|nr:hypothetical protein [Bacteroidales bacterium]
MKKTIITLVLGMVSLACAAQEVEQKVRTSLYGYVRNEFFYDTRQSLTSGAGLLYFLPLDKNENILGEDLNAQAASRFLSMESRIGLRIAGIDTWGAKISANLEGDFDGFSISGGNFTSNTVLRLRQAWTKAAWEHVEVVVGQTWHPMFGPVFPSVLGVSAGAPFNPLNRSPQLRVDYKHKNLRVYGAALYQMQYLSVGPRGSSPEYVRDNILPELYAGLDYSPQSFVVGAGASTIGLRPRIIGEKQITVNEERVAIPVKVSDHVTSYAAQAFAQYKAEKLTVKAKALYGQNMAHLLQLSGYGISAKLADGSYEYSNLNTGTWWFNATYGKTYQVGIFTGFSKNYGSSKPLLEKPYTFGPNNLAHLFRLCPQFLYTYNSWHIGMEYEVTQAAYGTFSLAKGRVTDTHNVINHRIFAEIVYNF